MKPIEVGILGGTGMVGGGTEVEGAMRGMLTTWGDGEVWVNRATGSNPYNPCL